VMVIFGQDLNDLFILHSVDYRSGHIDVPVGPNFGYYASSCPSPYLETFLMKVVTQITLASLERTSRDMKISE
jgi:hypothetical protein